MRFERDPESGLLIPQREIIAPRRRFALPIFRRYGAQQQAMIAQRIAGGGGTPYYDEVIADAPVGYWRLGEISGTSAADSGSSGIAGTYSGGYTLDQTSLIATDSANKAVLLNGSTGHVLLTNSTTLRFLGSYTLECLVKFAAFPSSGASAWFLGKAYDAGTNKSNYAMSVAVAGSVKTLEVGCYDGTTGQGASYDVSSWTTGTIYHVVGSFDGTNYRLYINGTNVATNAGTGNHTSGRALNIGRESNSFANQSYLNGTIDEVAVFNTKLSDTRIAAHATAAGF